MIQVQIPIDVFQELSQFLGDEGYPIGFTTAVERALRLWCREAHVHPSEHLVPEGPNSDGEFAEKQLLEVINIVNRFQAELKVRNIEVDLPAALAVAVERGLKESNFESAHTSRNTPTPLVVPIKERSHEKSIQRRSSSKTKSGKHLRVLFTDGTVIQEMKAASTMAKAVDQIGSEKVASLGMTMYGFPLISEKPMNTEKYSGWQLLQSGKFVFTHSNTQTKKRQLEEIISRLSISATVELVDA